MRHTLFCLLLISLPTWAGVYTYIDADGNRVFTDKPRSSTYERVDLPTTNSMSGQTNTPPTPVKMEEPTADVVRYQVLRILVPEPDATIRDGAGNLIVTADSEPGLITGHSYRLLLDGQAVGEPGRSPVFPLQNIDRGTHQLAIEIIDAQGRTLERTPSQPFHVIRMSLAQKRNANPCKKDDYGVRPECPIKDKPPEEDDGPLSILPFF
ncbi:DUF4124 domain-containing protein [Pseudomonas sp. GD03944]|uniref:DUF4124 domain-containing protein n=1 Tax=Pseudomonas sp. GD03944 TaxID=2975409 RepID=UPI002449959D|nr:DUF4124 domain-containing protein [Pseudomonas sp. GD03944]MDH1264072.1 DUF4124 domain-containing protein [Pseudomonas sp. GD03944]